jgi:hypothetical protein
MHKTNDRRLIVVFNSSYRALRIIYSVKPNRSSLGRPLNTIASIASGVP